MTKKAVLTALLCIIIAVCTITTTFAWLVDQNNINPGISGGGFTGYFYAGDGKTPETAYQIKDPIHVYNLAWLQYMGLLNKDDNGNVKQLYFELVDDIDMTGIVLPPIGTTENPFIGHFDGNGYCISKLTVSNYLQGSIEGATDGIVNRPLSVVSIEGKYVSIVGFFGVVGDINGDLGLADDSTVEGIENKVNAVHDLFLDGLTIRTETKETLVGLFAGYVNGSISNVGIANGDIIIGDQVYPLTAETALEMGQIISMYSLIGKYDSENVEWKDDPFGNGWGNAGSGSEGWGGSINMLELQKRIEYLVGAVGVEKIGSSYRVVGKYGYTGIFASNQPYSVSAGWNTNKLGYSLLDGTVMPLNVDKDILNTDVIQVEVNGYIFNTLAYYRDNKALNLEPVSKTTNSGYIIGGGNKTSTAPTNGNSFIDYRVDYPSGYGSSRITSVGIFKSINTKLDNTAAFPNNNNFHMLTIDVNGNTYVIKDSYNANATTWFTSNYSSSQFINYNDSKLNFSQYIINGSDGDTGVRTAFVNDYAGKTLLQGIQFKSSISKVGVTTPGVTLSEAGITGFYDDVWIFNKEYDNYEMIKGAINFSIKESGIVTAIAGTYSAHGSMSTNINNNLHFTLFSIFQVSRNDKNQITDYTLIETIHKVTQNGKVTYEYNLGADYSKSGYELVYNSAKMNDMTEVGAAYYFEIPLNDGDYAIGGLQTQTTTYGSVLMYLDIGANGDMSSGGPSEEPVPSHSIDDIKFVESSYIKETEDNPGSRTTEGYPVITFEIKLEAGTNTSGLHVSYVPSGTDVSITVTDLSTPPKTTTEFAVTQKKKE